MPRWISHHYINTSSILPDKINGNSTMIRFNHPCSSYTNCSPIKLKIKAGTYFIKMCGARGGDYSTFEPQYKGKGGRGGCAQGVITFHRMRTLFLFLGGRGKDQYNDKIVQEGGFNGGGWAYGGACSGGGSTDLRLKLSDLKSRIIVAGGGGGANDFVNGGNGGGINGSPGIPYHGYQGGEGGGQVPQNSSALIGDFGQGTSNQELCKIYYDGGAGGGGYFGGGRAVGNGPSGGGGSGYISGLDGCFGVKNQEVIESSGKSIHYSGLYFNNGSFGIENYVDDGYAEIVQLLDMTAPQKRKFMVQHLFLLAILNLE